MDKDLLYTIYMHITPNGKRYIGITKQDVLVRWGKDGIRYKRCTAFWKAIEKYGWDNIEHEIIDHASDLQTANEKERQYIQLYKTHDKRYGYNCTEGGDGVSGWEATDEQKQKNSEAKKIMWTNPEMRKRLTAERQKRGNTEAEKKRLSFYRIATWNDPEKAAILRKHLSEIAKNQEYIDRRRQAIQRKYAESPGFVEKMRMHLDKLHSDPEITKKRSSSMKITWKENRERFLENRTYLSGEDNPMARAIICLESGQQYPTARAAELDTGVSYKAISNAVRGKAKTAGGYHWEYVDEKLRPARVRENRCKKAIKCIETGAIYDSIAGASKETGISSTAIGNCVRGLSKTAGSFHWEYV
ncbi:MAG: GIY-YIG nuclease family protein [Clostridiales bacterium]|nr:GIY-YIG nuclease family protein [Clostridiales bacterium]